MTHVIIARTITDFTPEDWNRCFPGELETWGYLHATERAGLPNFEHRYFGVVEQGRLTAATVAFHTTYRLDTTVQGRMKRVMARLTRWFPRLLSLRLACLGSPVTERCPLGFAPDLPTERRSALLALLLAAFEQDAAAAGAKLQAIKDAPAAADTLWSGALAARYQRMPSLPTAFLPIDFTNQEGYFARLSRATRKDMRRKLKSRDAVRVEFRRSLTGVLDQVARLYEQTKARSDLQFEELTPAWFTNVLAEAPDTAGCFLYWVGDVLAGFNLVLHNDALLIDKFVGLDADLGRKHDLYFVSWFNNIDYCLSHGLSCYQSGQAEYGPKKRLASRFSANWIWFRHANPILHRVLVTVSRLLRLERYDPELAALLETAA